MSLLLLLVACSAPPSTPPAMARPNLLVIDIDTVRADRLDASYDGEPVMPTVQAIAKRGVRFENAYSQAGWTLPALTSLLSGRYPLGVQLGGDVTSLFPQHARRIGGILSIFDYRTGALWNAGVPTVFSKVSDGFGEQAVRAARLNEMPDDLLPFRELLDRTTAGSTEPFFLFLHDWDAHVPGANALTAGMHHFVHDDVECKPMDYDKALPRLSKQLGPERAMAHVLGHYDGAIWRYDAFLASVMQLLEERGLLDKTIVMVTSNHGEGFGEHVPGVAHGPLYDELLRVPLVVAGPGIGPAGTVIDTPVQFIDIAPTLLELAGIPKDETMNGQSFAPMLRGEPPPTEPRWTYSLTSPGTVSVRTPTHKLIQMDWSDRTTSTHPVDRQLAAVGPRFEYYDLVADPGERENLFDAAPEATLQLMVALQSFRAARKVEASHGDTVQVDEHARQVLREAGYWGIVAGGEPPTGGAPAVEPMKREAAKAEPAKGTPMPGGPDAMPGAGPGQPGRPPQAPKAGLPPPPASEQPLVEQTFATLQARLDALAQARGVAAPVVDPALVPAAVASETMRSAPSIAAIEAYRAAFAALPTK